MRHTPERHTDAADRTLKDIRRKTRKRYSSEDEIRIVLAGLRGEDTIAEFLSSGRHRAEPVLQLAERVPRSWQEASGWRYGPRGQHWRGAEPRVVKGVS